MARPAPPEKCLTMDLDSLLEAYPEAARVFARRGMLCVGCPIARFHTLEDAAALYGLELAELVEEIDEKGLTPGPLSTSATPEGES
jgi:hybrid cluster-associated redox disulfide protein